MGVCGGRAGARGVAPHGSKCSSALLPQPRRLRSCPSPVLLSSPGSAEPASFSPAVIDDCGICNGLNKDVGCDGMCFSGGRVDCNGICNGCAFALCRFHTPAATSTCPVRRVC